jgi:hypothetical protein
VYGIIRGGKISDLLVHVEHLAVPANDSRKTRELAKPKPEADHLGQIAESGQNAYKGPRIIVHAGYRHFDLACIARPRGGINGVGAVSQRPGGLAAKGAFAPAERSSECEVAIPPEHLLARIPRDLLSRPVEKQDSPIEVMGDYALHHVIENILKVLLLSDKIFEGYQRHKTPLFAAHWGL